jgi:flagellar basal-body rod protein FlgF
MENSGYVTLTRQVGLMREMQVVANNLANMSTTGFRREDVTFSEHVRGLGPDHASVSMARIGARHTDVLQGGLTRTGGLLDLALEGPGYFQIAHPEGPLLTREGAFARAADGSILTKDGHPLLDAGGAPLQVPPEADDLAIGRDGTIAVGGRPVAQIGLWQPENAITLTRRDGVRFSADAVLPAEGRISIHQGFLEASNVSPVNEVTRMIEVQRSYELGQTFMDKEDERIRTVLRALSQ